jgi:hypothetical protein
MSCYPFRAMTRGSVLIVAAALTAQAQAPGSKRTTSAVGQLGLTDAAAPAPPSLPQQPGLTIVQAVQDDTLRGNARGDYEAVIIVTSFSAAGSELAASALVRNTAGRREWLHVRRTVTASDLRTAHPDPRIRHEGCRAAPRNDGLGTVARGDGRRTQGQRGGAGAQLR